MDKISKASIKRIVKGNSNIVISESAADAIAKILEKKAKRIAKYAVKRAKKKNRKMILQEDIETYMIKYGDWIDEIAFLSRSEKGSIKLEYNYKGNPITKQWDFMEEKTLETTFDHNGAMLAQELTKLGKAQVNKRIEDILEKASIHKKEERTFSRVRLNKKCPSCGSDSLVRHVDEFSDIPVMPLYHCNYCKTKSYYLTNTYLEYLVYNNKELFEKTELVQFDKDQSGFIAELKEYIIRIFASKRIMCIK